MLLYKGGLHQLPEVLSISSSYYCLLVGFTQYHRVSLPPLALVQNQAMSQVEQVLIPGHPLRNLHPGYFIVHPEAEGINSVLSIDLVHYG